MDKVTSPIRCIHCNTWIHPNDMLKHGIDVHNNSFAKSLQKKLDELNRDAEKLGFQRMAITDILPEEEIQARLLSNEKEKEKLR